MPKSEEQKSYKDQLTTAEEELKQVRAQMAKNQEELKKIEQSTYAGELKSAEVKLEGLQIALDAANANYEVQREEMLSRMPKKDPPKQEPSLLNKVFSKAKTPEKKVDVSELENKNNNQQSSSKIMNALTPPPPTNEELSTFLKGWQELKAEAVRKRNEAKDTLQTLKDMKPSKFDEQKGKKVKVLEESILESIRQESQVSAKAITLTQQSQKEEMAKHILASEVIKALSQNPPDALANQRAIEEITALANDKHKTMDTLFERIEKIVLKTSEPCKEQAEKVMNKYDIKMTSYDTKIQRYLDKHNAVLCSEMKKTIVDLEKYRNRFTHKNDKVYQSHVQTILDYMKFQVAQFGKTNDEITTQKLQGEDIKNPGFKKFEEAREKLKTNKSTQQIVTSFDEAFHKAIAEKAKLESPHWADKKESYSTPKMR